MQTKRFGLLEEASISNLNVEIQTLNSLELIRTYKSNLHIHIVAIQNSLRQSKVTPYYFELYCVTLFEK